MNSKFSSSFCLKIFSGLPVAFFLLVLLFAGFNYRFESFDINAVIYIIFSVLFAIGISTFLYLITKKSKENLNITVILTILISEFSFWLSGISLISFRASLSLLLFFAVLLTINNIKLWQSVVLIASMAIVYPLAVFLFPALMMYCYCTCDKNRKNIFFASGIIFAVVFLTDIIFKYKSFHGIMFAFSTAFCERNLNLNIRYLIISIPFCVFLFAFYYDLVKNFLTAKHKKFFIFDGIISLLFILFLNHSSFPVVIGSQILVTAMICLYFENDNKKITCKVNALPCLKFIKNNVWIIGIVCIFKGTFLNFLGYDFQNLITNIFHNYFSVN